VKQPVLGLAQAQQRPPLVAQQRPPRLAQQRPPRVENQPLPQVAQQKGAQQQLLPARA
jgi:hypothetical protein